MRSVVTVVPPCPAASRSWICRAQVEDLLLELLLLRLEVERRRDQRRPLLARDPDPRALGRELRGDQEAEHEQRDAERDLPGRDRADARRERRHARSSGRRRRSDGARPRRPRRRAAPRRRRRGRRSSADAAVSGAVTTTGVASAPAVAAPGSPWRPRRPASAPRRRAAGPSSPTAAGPAGAGCGPNCLRLGRPEVREPARLERGRGPRPAPAVNASSSVSPSAYAVTSATQRVLALRRARGSRSPTPTRRRRGTCGRRRSGTGRRGRPAGSARRSHAAASTRPRSLRAVALRQVDREALVEPAGREPVRVVDGRVEHEVDELVRDHDADPRRRRSRSGVISANSVRMSACAWPPTFSRVPGPERRPERLLVPVDVEVDGLGLGHAEQRRRCRVIACSPMLERLVGERLARRRTSGRSSGRP